MSDNKSLIWKNSSLPKIKTSTLAILSIIGYSLNEIIVNEDTCRSSTIDINTCVYLYWVSVFAFHFFFSDYEFLFISFPPFFVDQKGEFDQEEAKFSRSGSRGECWT